MRDVEFLEQRIEAALALLAALFDHFEHGADVVFDRQAAEDRGFLRQIADAEAGAAVHRHRRHVETVDLDLALVDRHQPGDHVEAGGLAGAVGAEQSDRLAGADAERHAVHHLSALVALGQAVGDQGALELVGIGTQRRRRRLRLRPARHARNQGHAVLHYGSGPMPIRLLRSGRDRHHDPAFAGRRPSCSRRPALRPVFICTVSLQPTSTLGPSDSTTSLPDSTSTSVFMSKVPRSPVATCLSDLT